MTVQPYTFEQARAAQTRASRAQEQAQDFVKNSYRAYADAERAYREALAKKITELRADGQPVTVVQDLAKGDPHVARLKHARDVADGVKEAAQHAIWRATADRRATEQLCAWSMRRELAEGAGYAIEPEPSSVIGGRT